MSEKSESKKYPPKPPALLFVKIPSAGEIIESG